VRASRHNNTAPHPQVVGCFDALEHVGDIRRALAAIARHLKPGGILALGLPAWDDPAGRQLAQQR
jgi:2-polyprenyl-3-methyl-5-hydroxy-6-metoxy-1,4-benzoquinol methylase